jgi:hypothetical protein
MKNALGFDVDRVQEEEVYKKPQISPFDFANAINHSKENLIVDDWSERQYNAWIVNKSMSYGADTVIYANEMNSRPHLERRLQFDFLINTVRPRKRYNKWLKAETVDVLATVQEYYGYSIDKARQVLPLLSDAQLEHIKNKLNRGGKS